MMRDSQNSASFPNTSFESLLNPEQASQLLLIHPKTLVRMARAGEVPALRMGKHWRFRASLLNIFVESKLESTSPACLER
jgi:excisionase family DNA binding protein